LKYKQLIQKFDSNIGSIITVIRTFLAGSTGSGIGPTGPLLTSEVSKISKIMYPITRQSDPAGLKPSAEVSPNILAEVVPVDKKRKDFNER
jgi:hypothetical protein